MDRPCRRCDLEVSAHLHWRLGVYCSGLDLRPPSNTRGLLQAPWLVPETVPRLHLELLRSDCDVSDAGDRLRRLRPQPCHGSRVGRCNLMAHGCNSSSCLAGAGSARPRPRRQVHHLPLHHGLGQRLAARRRCSRRRGGWDGDDAEQASQSRGAAQPCLGNRSLTAPGSLAVGSLASNGKATPTLQACVCACTLTPRSDRSGGGYDRNF
mmetsp:Transcript_56560/g.132466  ORF Transcript_56560/g.132466 Transcript_56560/m.132466 type:complete len:209 (+) Transcript_56560:1582-2208(+)